MIFVMQYFNLNHSVVVSKSKAEKSSKKVMMKTHFRHKMASQDHSKSSILGSLEGQYGTS